MGSSALGLCLLTGNHPIHQQHQRCHKYKNTDQPNHNEVEGIQIFRLFVIGSAAAQTNEGPGDGLGSTPQRFFWRTQGHPQAPAC
jgi:hypothetical protein